MTISVLLPCTASKRSTVPPVALREFPAGKSRTDRERFDCWWSALRMRLEASEEDLLPAKDRYKGAGWQASLSLFRAAQGLGQVSGYVVSAGLGLVAMAEETPTYSATFNPGQLDSVSLDGRASIVRQKNQAWWRELEWVRQCAVSSLAGLSGRALVVMPPRYVEAVEPGLVELSKQIPITIYTTGRPLESLQRVTVRVRQNLKRVSGPGDGASDATLIARVANWCVEQLDDAAFDAPEVQRQLDALSDSAPERPKRPRATDEEVLAYLRKRLPLEPRPQRTASRLHGEFRASGRGCSVERFVSLFDRSLKEVLAIETRLQAAEAFR